MEQALDFMENNLGANKIKIEAQVYLIEFYKSLGFRAVSESFLEDGIPHVNMVWEKN